MSPEPNEGRRRAEEPPAPLGARRPTVLVVDDEPTLLRLACHTLELHGYEARAASDLDGALAALREDGQVDAVILDMTLGGETSGTPVSALRELAPRVGVIVSSGFDPSGFPGARDADEFLPKPYTLEQLVDCVARVLGREGDVERTR